MSEGAATMRCMDKNPDRPAIRALAAAVAVLRARNGVPGPPPTSEQVAAIVDGPRHDTADPITVPAAWLDNEDPDLTFLAAVRVLDGPQRVEREAIAAHVRAGRR